jgi:hypothetical protein
MSLTKPPCLSVVRNAMLMVLAAILPAACSTGVHTLESTARLNHAELVALCADLELRANLKCQWNALEQQSSIEDRQTWEIGCMARRDSARESFDNVCQPSRLGAPAYQRGDEPDHQ